MRSVRKLFPSSQRKDVAEINVVPLKDSAKDKTSSKSRLATEGASVASGGGSTARRRRRQKYLESRSSSVPRQRTEPPSSSRSASTPRASWRNRTKTSRPTKSSSKSTTPSVSSSSKIRSTKRATEKPANIRGKSRSKPRPVVATTDDKVSRGVVTSKLRKEKDKVLKKKKTHKIREEVLQEKAPALVIAVPNRADTTSNLCTDKDPTRYPTRTTEKRISSEQRTPLNRKKSSTLNPALEGLIIDTHTSRKEASIASSRGLHPSPSDEVGVYEGKNRHVKETIDLPTSPRVISNLQELKSPTGSVVSARTRSSTRSTSSKRSRSSRRSRSTMSSRSTRHLEHCIEVQVSRAILQKCAHASNFLKTEEASSDTATATDILSDLFSVAEENGIDAVPISDALVPRDSWLEGLSDTKRERVSSCGSSIGNASTRYSSAASTSTEDPRSMSSETTPQVHNLTGVLNKFDNKRHKSDLEKHLESKGLLNEKKRVSSPRLPPSSEDSTARRNVKVQPKSSKGTSSSKAIPTVTSSSTLPEVPTRGSFAEVKKSSSSIQGNSVALDEMARFTPDSNWTAFEDDSFKKSVPPKSATKKIIHQSQDNGFGDVVVYSSPPLRKHGNKGYTSSPTCVREASWQNDFAKEDTVEEEKKEEGGMDEAWEPFSSPVFSI